MMSTRCLHNLVMLLLVVFGAVIGANVERGLIQHMVTCMPIPASPTP